MRSATTAFSLVVVTKSRYFSRLSKNRNGSPPGERDAVSLVMLPPLLPPQAIGRSSSNLRLAARPVQVAVRGRRTGQASAKKRIGVVGASEPPGGSIVGSASNRPRPCGTGEPGVEAPGSPEEITRPDEAAGSSTTGHGAWRTTSAATLPRRSRSRPVRPWVVANTNVRVVALGEVDDRARRLVTVKRPRTRSRARSVCAAGRPRAPGMRSRTRRRSTWTLGEMTSTSHGTAPNSIAHDSATGRICSLAGEPSSGTT